jgi:hypothetical protein
MALKAKSAFCDSMEASVEKNANGVSGIGIGSIWGWECYDKDGNLKWADITRNTVQHMGLTTTLNCLFHGQTPPTTWYATLFESDTAMTGGTATYAVPVYTETTAYDEVTRPEFVESTATTAGTSALSNSASKASFTMNDTKTIYGGALVGGTCGTFCATKNDTAATGGILYCASKFTVAKDVVNDDVVKLTVTVQAVSG